MPVSSMDPRDRLWGELIFPRCGELRALLALRAVCRAFRAQLNKSRLWLPLTMELPQLRFDERVDGWRGVERAMRRKANTRTNCDAVTAHAGLFYACREWRSSRS